MKNEKKGYAVGEVFRHTDGKVYQCVEDEHCGGCAFEYNDSDCRSLYCSSFGREDGRPVKFILVAEPAEGMLYRAENGRMYRLAKGEHSEHFCVCDTGPWLNCSELYRAVFGYVLLNDWYWAPIEEDAPAPVEPQKPPEPPKRHIELSVVRVEGDTVKFRIAEQTHRCDEFSRQDYPREFKAANGFKLRSAANPKWGSDTSTLYCLGFERNDDNFEIVCTAGEFSQICEAVAEYNSTDGRGCKSRWPKGGDRYFCVTAIGTIDHLKFAGYQFDRMMQDFGNIFRTKEEAEAALVRVKQVLKK